MSTQAQPHVETARALLSEVGPDVASGEIGAALERVVSLLHLRLAPWIGPDGCERLVHRALIGAAREHPGLRGASVRAGVSRFERLDVQQRGASPSTARAAAEAFLATVLRDLAALVGERVAVRIVLPDSPSQWARFEPDDTDDA